MVMSDISLQLSQVDKTEYANLSSEFLRIATQFLANTPVIQTRETYGRELGFFISWYGKDGNIANITFEDLLNYKVMLENRYSSATVAKKIAALRSFFKFAKNLNVISQNPTDELRVAKPIKNRIPTHFTEEEVQRLIKMPDRRTILGKRDTVILALLANTGMRREELVILKMDSFIYHTEKHKQKAKVYVKILGKGNKERMVRVHDDLLPYLEDWVKVRPQGDHDYFLTNKDGERISVKALRYLMQKHGKAAGISKEKLHPHSFRHTFCINLAMAEVPLHVIQELTGHKMLNTLRIYLKVTQKETDKAIAKLPSWNMRKKSGEKVF